jgi:hypothetical protein
MADTPENAIREWLAHPNLKEVGGKPLPFRVVEKTIGFVKKRGAPDRQLWWVTCDSDGGPRGREHWAWTVLVSRDESLGWTAHGEAGGSGLLPVRGSAWANLGGGWGRQGFNAGGTVEDAGQGVSLVRLTDARGSTLEDTVEDGVVLFLSDEPVTMPMRLDLLHVNGRVIASDEWGFVDE